MCVWWGVFWQHFKHLSVFSVILSYLKATLPSASYANMRILTPVHLDLWVCLGVSHFFNIISLILFLIQRILICYALLHFLLMLLLSYYLQSHHPSNMYKLSNYPILYPLLINDIIVALSHGNSTFFSILIHSKGRWSKKVKKLCKDGQWKRRLILTCHHRN